MKRLLSSIILLVICISLAFALCEEGQIDINSATKSDLTKIVYIGDARAEAIIDARPFEKVDNLIDIKGIGEVYLSKIKEQGLACIGEEKIANTSSETSDENTKEEIKKEPIRVVIERPVENKSIKKNPDPITLKAISLETKNIKSEVDKDYSSTYAIYGLFGFLLLIILLMFVRYRRYTKNEFT